MKKLLSLVVFCAINLSFALGASADIKVIVHPSNTAELGQPAISRIYMGKMSSYPKGGKVTPVSQPEGTEAANTFNEKVLKKSNAQLKSYWSKLVFTGKGTPPKQLSGDLEVLDLIQSDPQAIGYVSGSASTDGVRVIGSF